MQTTGTEQANRDAIARRADGLFAEHQQSIFRRTDRMFAGLMVFQWLAGIATAIWISPRTWAGPISETHPHVWTAVFLGGAIALLPVVFALRLPGRALTRHVIAIGQSLATALLIHLTGGRIETHFHVFGSLTFLAFYRDWRALVTATIVVAADHFVRGIYFPQSIYGVIDASSFRWLEHAAWVLFLDFFLTISILQGMHEMREIAERHAQLEATKANIEQTVLERTAELEKLHRELIVTSHRAGKAEVATGVLHNVGNTLNSVNVSVNLLAERLRNSSVSGLAKATLLIDEHRDDLGEFITGDERGRHLPQYLRQLAKRCTAERDSALEELQSLVQNIEHIKEIVNMQQSYANVAGFIEQVDLAHLIHDAMKVNDAGLIRHGVEPHCDLRPTRPIATDKNKVLQILINLISNAKYALSESKRPDKQLHVRVSQPDADHVEVVVTDNGVGIRAENLTRIFQHGFTTRKEGHGFGLHSSALAAKELGGSLLALSEGTGRGATFILELPVVTGATQSIERELVCVA